MRMVRGSVSAAVPGPDWGYGIERRLLSATEPKLQAQHQGRYRASLSWQTGVKKENNSVGKTTLQANHLLNNQTTHK